MPPPRLIDRSAVWFAVVCLASMVAACGGSVDDTAPLAPAERATTPDPGPADDPQTTPTSTWREGATHDACVPGEGWCLDHQTAFVCAVSGKGFETRTCAAEMGCDAAAGDCRLRVCEPDAIRCEGTGGYVECLGSGTAWDVQEKSCPNGTVCADGQCKYCPPDQTYCEEVDAWAICNAKGNAYDVVGICPAGTMCHEPSGDCRLPVCEPGEVACYNAFARKICLPSGTGWDQGADACPADHVCREGACVFESCLPSVMLLVDASTSMMPHWEAVQESVHDLVEGHMEALFGLTFFPSDLGCGTSSEPMVQIHAYAPEELSLFFQSRTPGGSTPLVDALVEMAGGAPDVFGNYGGALVVLSDGQDVCSSKVGGDEAEVARTATRALFEDHGVRTYVIGYAFGGDGHLLQAIAEEGGTGLETWQAADEGQELGDALELIVADYEQCIAD